MNSRIGHARRQLGHAAEVIAVPVRGDQVIDRVRPASLTAAMMRSASRAAAGPGCRNRSAPTRRTATRRASRFRPRRPRRRCRGPSRSPGAARRPRRQQPQNDEPTDRCPHRRPPWITRIVPQKVSARLRLGLLRQARPQDLVRVAHRHLELVEVIGGSGSEAPGTGRKVMGLTFARGVTRGGRRRSGSSRRGDDGGVGLLDVLENVREVQELRRVNHGRRSHPSTSSAIGASSAVSAVPRE